MILDQLPDRHYGCVTCSSDNRELQRRAIRRVLRTFGDARCGGIVVVINPTCVGEQFTGLKGEYVKTDDTIKGFREILDGKCDDMPEQAFYMVGTIDQAREKAQKMAAAA